MIQPRLPDLSLFQKPLALERRTSPTRAEFEKEYLTGVGCPVVLTDVTSSWPAMHKWTFDFFAAGYGDETVIASDQLRHPTKMFRMKLRRFLELCDFTGAAELELPLYLGFQPFSHHPELLCDFSPPPVVDCIYANSKGTLYEWYVREFGVILIGSSGTVTSLHADLFGTHNWLAQICGSKHWLLFAPGDADNVVCGKVDLLHPEALTAPNLRNAQPYETVLEPGEVIFVPQGWYHHVVSLSPSISISFNFVNQTNLLAHILGMSRDWPLWSKRIKSLETQIESRFPNVPSNFVQVGSVEK